MAQDPKIGIEVDQQKASQSQKTVNDLGAAIRGLQKDITDLRVASASGVGIEDALIKAQQGAINVQRILRDSSQSFPSAEIEKAEKVLGSLDGVAKEAGKSLDKFGKAADNAGIDVQRMAERIALRLAILAAFHETLKVVEEKLFDAGTALEAFAFKSGVGGDAVLAFDSALQKLKDDPVKLIASFGPVILVIEQMASVLKQVRAEYETFSEGGIKALLKLTPAQLAARISLDELSDASTRAQGLAEASLQKNLRLAASVLANAKATDADREAIRAKLIEDEKLLKKNGQEIPDALDKTIRALRSATEVVDEYSKAVGIKTPEQIDQGVAALIDYRNGLGEASGAGREAADTMVKSAETWVKAIESLPTAERAAHTDQLETLHAFLSEFNEFTTKYAQGTDKQAAASKKLAEQEAKDYDTRRKNAESFFDGLAKGFDQLEDHLTGKDSSKTVDGLQKQLEELKARRDELQNQPNDLAGSDELAGILTKITDTSNKLDDAMREARLSTAHFVDEAGPQLAKVTSFIEQNITSSERFAKIIATQTPGVVDDIQSVIDSMQRTAQNADLIGQKLTHDDFTGFRERLADAFKGGNEESRKFADSILNTNETVRGSFDSVSRGFDRLRGDQKTIAEGERAVGDALKDTKQDFDAETDSINANSDAKERNISADGALSGRGAGSQSAAPTDTPDSRDGTHQPIDLRKGGGDGITPSEVTLPGGTGVIATNKQIEHSLETLTKDGLLPAKDATSDLDLATKGLSKAHAEASSLAKRFEDDVVEAHKEVTKSAGEFEQSVADVAKQLGNEGAETEAANEALARHETTIQDVVAASKAQAGATKEVAQEITNVSGAVEVVSRAQAGLATNTQDVADATNEAADAAQSASDESDEFVKSLDDLVASQSDVLTQVLGLTEGIVDLKDKQDTASDSTSALSTATAVSSKTAETAKSQWMTLAQTIDIAENAAQRFLKAQLAINEAGG